MTFQNFVARTIHWRQSLRHEHRLPEEVRHHTRPQHRRGEGGGAGRPQPRVLRRFRHLLPRVPPVGHPDLQPGVNVIKLFKAVIYGFS